MELILITQHFYTNQPLENFDESYCKVIKRKAIQAPIVTFYGRTRDGTRAALHIHGYFPYFYVQLPKHYEPDFVSMTNALERDANYNKNKSQPIIHSMEIVEKLPIYGYHTEKVRFIKISVYNVDAVRKLAEMCCDGVCGIKLQPYEAHIDIFQQIYTEYDISGME